MTTRPIEDPHIIFPTEAPNHPFVPGMGDSGQTCARATGGMRICGRPEESHHAGPARPSTAELAAIGRPGTVRASARAGSKAHLAELTRAQLDVLKMAIAAGGTVSQNGSTGVTRPAIRALAAKGYGEAMFDMVRRHLIIGFRINDRGRRAVGQ